MEIKILGTGCKKCTDLEHKVREIVQKNNISAEIEKVTDIQDIISYKVISTPGLVINGNVKSYGFIPKDAQILSWLLEGK
ncbi:MAG: thioredoxin family protein [Ignavibacteria bacterium]|nr:thioredoxin family protein [Ignavibacteria bacterium]